VKRGAGQKSISSPGRAWPEDREFPTEKVELPVCPVCLHIGKHPGGSGVTYACTGPAGEQHKRTRMIRVTFKPTKPTRSPGG
jgi:hypothetical protein